MLTRHKIIIPYDTLFLIMHACTLMFIPMITHGLNWTHHSLGRVWEGDRRRGWGVNMVKTVRIIIPHDTSFMYACIITLTLTLRSPTDDETMVVFTTTIEENITTIQTAAGRSST
jgi:hypothetical protein